MFLTTQNYILSIKSSVENKRKLFPEKNFIIHNIILYPISSISLLPGFIIYHPIQQTIIATAVNTIIHTKASVIQKILIGTITIYFIASHLSINTHDIYTLGLTDRQKIMWDVINSINLDISPPLNHNKVASMPNPYIILWGGDLNFRQDYQDGAIPDQLTRFINTNPFANYYIKDLTNINLIQPTCKVQSNKPPKCVESYLNNDTKITCNSKNKKCTCNPSCTEKIKCYDEIQTRFPSYCDRILVLTPLPLSLPFTFESLSHPDIILKSKFTQFSDHNPIYNTITITNRVNAWGEFTHKYLKYKKKYLKLKNLNSNL